MARLRHAASVAGCRDDSYRRVALLEEFLIIFTRFNRIELLLPEDHIKPAIEAFSCLLGVAIDPPELLEGGQLWSSSAWEAGIELIAPHGGNGPLPELLGRQNNRGAIGPIVWEVSDLDPVRAHVANLGIEIVYEFPLSNGGRAIYLDSDACLGYTLSFIDRPLGPAEPTPGSNALISRINRVELLMPPEDLERARQFFERLLGIEIDPLEYLPEHHVLTTTNWDAKIELFGPGDEQSALHGLLATKGELGAIGPIVWEVPDIDAMKLHAESLGHRLIYEFETPDRKQICLADDTLFGYTATFTELLQNP